MKSGSAYGGTLKKYIATQHKLLPDETFGGLVKLKQMAKTLQKSFIFPFVCHPTSSPDTEFCPFIICSTPPSERHMYQMVMRAVKDCIDMMPFNPVPFPGWFAHWCCWTKQTPFIKGDIQCRTLQDNTAHWVRPLWKLHPLRPALNFCFCYRLLKKKSDQSDMRKN